MSLHWSQEIYVVIRAQTRDTPALQTFHSDRKRDQKGLTNSSSTLINIRHEVIAKLFVIPECLYPGHKRSGMDMVFQAVRTRFPLRIVAGMIEWKVLQLAHMKTFFQGGNMEIGAFRKTEHGVDERFLNRWSPRAMSGGLIEKETLLGLFEAARWAPSSNNNQPWRFLYARRETDLWPLFFDLLTESNRIWAIRAAVLIVVISKTTFDYNDKPARTHSFDAGAAWENLALQGALKGLVVHGMQGFDYDRAKETLRIPDGYQVEAMVSIGMPGRKEDLPENLREREFPSGRKSLADVVEEGFFPWPH
jgi:nitroreductase